MRKRPLLFVYLVVALWSSLVTPGRAQPDPRPILGQMISAFQNCGPPQVYQMLVPQLFQLIAAQTGGQGCYPAIRAAGPVKNMQLIGQQMFPVGPVYLIRVQHPTVAVDWFMGINQFTNQIQFLSFQPAGAVMPSIATGPTPTGGGGVPQSNPVPSTPPSTPTPPTVTNCNLYPGMC